MTGNQSQPCGLRKTRRSTNAWQDPMRQLGPLWPLTPAIFLNTSSGPDCPSPQVSRARLTQTQEAANNCPRVRREDERLYHRPVAEQVPRGCPHPDPWSKAQGPLAPHVAKGTADGIKVKSLVMGRLSWIICGGSTESPKSLQVET